MFSIMLLDRVMKGSIYFAEQEFMIQYESKWIQLNEQWKGNIEKSTDQMKHLSISEKFDR